MRPAKQPFVARITVFARPRSHKGVIAVGALTMPCTIGRSGATWRKREGDGCTPRAALDVIAWYAPPGPGRLSRRHGVPRPITRAVGWCDDPGHPAYNRAIRLPVSAGHESMARNDGKYDCVGVLSWNVRRACAPVGARFSSTSTTSLRRARKAAWR